MNAPRLHRFLEIANDFLRKDPGMKIRRSESEGKAVAADSPDIILMCKQILDAGKVVRPFVMGMDFSECTKFFKTIAQETWDRYADIDALPFDCCSFELPGKQSFAIGLAPGATHTYGPGHQTTELHVNSFIVLRAHGNVVFFAHYKDTKIHNSTDALACINMDMPVYYNQLSALTVTFLEMLKVNEETRVASLARLKIKNINGSKETLKINDVVIISNQKCPRKAQAAAELERQRKEFSHRWETRGHWRTCGGIGKAPDGSRTVLGKTWVKDCIKGPEDKDIVYKTRIVV